MTLRLSAVRLEAPLVAAAVLMGACVKGALAATPMQETAAASPPPTATAITIATPSQGEQLVLGEVTVVVRTSRTASLFHATDQLSQWSPFSHPPYQRSRPAGEASDALLARQVKLRAKRDGALDSSPRSTSTTPTIVTRSTSPSRREP